MLILVPSFTCSSRPLSALTDTVAVLAADTHSRAPMNCREWTFLVLTLLLLTFSTIGFAMFAAFFPPAMVP